MSYVTHEKPLLYQTVAFYAFHRYHPMISLINLVYNL